MKRYASLCTLVASLFVFANPTQSQSAPAESSALQQYIYVLKLIPRLQVVDNWTEADNQVVAAHFERLKQMTEAGTVLLAGRTLGMSNDDFGIVILEAPSEDDAHDLMNADPTVREGIMTAQLFPYRIALMHTPPTADS